MDGELGESEAAVVEQHVQACAECRECVAAYEEASRGFAAYYDATARTAAVQTPARRVPLWIPVAAAVAAIAAMLAIAFVDRSVKPGSAPQVARESTPSVAGIKTPVLHPEVNRDAMAQQKMVKPEFPQGLKPGVYEARNGTAESRALTPGIKALRSGLPQVQGKLKGRALTRGAYGTGSKSTTSDWAMAEPAIQIAIPADAMFPPGAVPEGMTYIANLSLAADGSVQGFRLRP
jgi:hypothetical protein